MSVSVDKKAQTRVAPWESMSFACGGWLQFYLFGVAKAIQAKGLDRGVQYYGCSAGALAALGLSLNGDFDCAVNFCKEECITEAYKGGSINISGLFKIDKYVMDCLDSHGQLNNYTRLKPGDLNIAVTRLPYLRPEIVSSFTSVEDLRSCILASCAAFPAASIVKRQNHWYIDGGLSDFQPVKDENTVTVSPFYFSACDIKPSRYVPFWWAFMPPKSSDTIDWLYNLGWEDATAYIASRNIPESPEARSDLREVARKRHSYDVRHRISLYRFLGYKLSDMTSQQVAFVMDMLLLILFVVVLKPLSIVTIYCELFLRLLTTSVAFVVFKIFSFGAPSKRISKYSSQLEDCLLCIFSLSLFLRFFYLLPSSVELRKHRRLQRVSLLYRIFNHIM